MEVIARLVASLPNTRANMDSHQVDLWKERMCRILLQFCLKFELSGFWPRNRCGWWIKETETSAQCPFTPDRPVPIFLVVLYCTIRKSRNCKISGFLGQALEL